MLDLKYVRENIDFIEESIRNRASKLSLQEFKNLEQNRREVLKETENLKAFKNKASEEISKLKKDKKDVSNIITEMQGLGEKIKALEQELGKVEGKLTETLLLIPNPADPSVPVGDNESSNREIRKWGSPLIFDFEPLAHWALGQNLGILDLETAAQIAGGRFPLYKGQGARLERALINFMLDLHTKDHGYQEIIPPFMVNPSTMLGSGQLPRFEQELFKCRDDDYYLIPTAEVPLVNIYKNQILNADKLPINFTAYTPCFRREAGSYGKDVRGLIRQHQFNKVELVKFCKPEESEAEHETLTAHAEAVLKLLKLPYRVVSLCTGELGFASAKTYDLEVWLASSKSYREISSCSNCKDFQARRANIRFRRDKNAKPEFVHTLNGSGLAVGRTWIAIVENYQQKDGSILVPDALVPYMQGTDRIRG